MISRYDSMHGFMRQDTRGRKTNSNDKGWEKNLRFRFFAGNRDYRDCPVPYVSKHFQRRLPRSTAVFCNFRLSDVFDQWKILAGQKLPYHSLLSKKIPENLSGIICDGYEYLHLSDAIFQGRTGRYARRNHKHFLWLQQLVANSWKCFLFHAPDKHILFHPPMVSGSRDTNLSDLAFFILSI